CAFLYSSCQVTLERSDPHAGVAPFSVPAGQSSAVEVSSFRQVAWRPDGKEGPDDRAGELPPPRPDTNASRPATREPPARPANGQKGESGEKDNEKDRRPGQLPSPPLVTPPFTGLRELTADAVAEQVLARNPTVAQMVATSPTASRCLRSCPGAASSPCA